MSERPKAEIRQITPDWAKQVLDKHNKSIIDGEFRQRPLNEKVVRQYASDMKAGNWALTGQGISFDSDGNLLDGQHRLAAIISAGMTVPMLVMWDLDPDNGGVKTINLFDIGKKRNAAQQLKINGMNYYSELASGARALLCLVRGNIRTNTTVPQVIATADLMKNNMTNMIEVLSAGNQKHKTRGYILAPLVLLGTVEPDAAELFATEFNEMTNLKKTSPVLHYARFLDRPSHIKGGTNYTLFAMKALCSALFLYCNDKKVEQRITGNDEHVEWLLKLAKNAVNKIRQVSGITLTMDELQQGGTQISNP